MRKLLLGAVVAVAAMAIAAPTAFGALAPPYDDYDNDNWSKVVASDTDTGAVCEGPYWEDGCELEGEADGSWYWRAPSGWIAECVEGTLGYRISGNGATMRTTTAWDDWTPYVGPFFCGSRQPVSQADGQTFWSHGSICAHEPTGTYWAFQYFRLEKQPGWNPPYDSYSDQYIQGYSYGQLTSSNHPNEVDGLDFGDPTTPYYHVNDYAPTTIADGLRHRVSFEFDRPIQLYADDIPCGWGVLS